METTKTFKLLTLPKDKALLPLDTIDNSNIELYQIHLGEIKPKDTFFHRGLREYIGIFDKGFIGNEFGDYKITLITNREELLKQIYKHILIVT